MSLQRLECTYSTGFGGVKRRNEVGNRDSGLHGALLVWVVTGDRKWSRTLPRGTKLCRGSHHGRRHIALESLRPRMGAARWGNTRGGPITKSGKHSKHAKQAKHTNRPNRPKHTKGTMSHLEAWGHVYFGYCAGDGLGDVTSRYQHRHHAHLWTGHMFVACIDLNSTFKV
ncbi:hypothetical protein EDB86DRAFT_2831868 [Lactarius hatsudake]|nr:hypothetical protein EDB86DRAFT_2831868 [Lactarius hatsudake]